MKDDFVGFIFIIIVVYIVGFVFGMGAGRAVGYRSGQIDYANNEIYYRLEKQADNTTDWIYDAESD